MKTFDIQKIQYTPHVIQGAKIFFLSNKTMARYSFIDFCKSQCAWGRDHFPTRIDFDSKSMRLKICLGRLFRLIYTNTFLPTMRAWWTQSPFLFASPRRTSSSSFFPGMTISVKKLSRTSGRPWAALSYLTEAGKRSRKYSEEFRNRSSLGSLFFLHFPGFWLVFLIATFFILPENRFIMNHTTLQSNIAALISHMLNIDSCLTKETSFDDQAIHGEQWEARLTTAGNFSPFFPKNKQI